MANAKKCDRCGKFFDRCRRTVEIITSNDHHRNVSFDCGINDDPDLCDDCIKSFEDWWANRTQIKIERKDPSIDCCYNCINISGVDKWEAKDND